MKRIDRVFLCSCLVLFVGISAFGQEKISDNPQTKKEKAAQIKAGQTMIADEFLLLPSACVRKMSKNLPPVIKDLILDKNEFNSVADANNEILIKVSTAVSDAEDDILIYKYEVSGGRILGQGKNIVWDLTKAVAGTYTVKVSVDDGCDYCGNTIIKTVVVK